MPADVPGSESPITEVVVDFTETTGAIEGVVTDDALVPLEGALVTLSGSAQTVTNGYGAFGFSFVAPGVQTLGVSMQGHADAQAEVEVVAGVVSKASVSMVSASTLAAYHETWVQAGNIACGVAWKTPAYTNNPAVCGATSLVDNSGAVERFRNDFGLGPADESWRGAWVETSWESTQALGPGMKTTWAVTNGAFSALTGTEAVEYSQVDVGYPQGVSPLGLRVPHESMYNVEGLCNENVSCWLVSWHYAMAHALGGNGEVDVGVTLMQRYDDWVTLFHWGDLPDDFSALPDA